MLVTGIPPLRPISKIALAWLGPAARHLAYDYSVLGEVKEQLRRIKGITGSRLRAAMRSDWTIAINANLHSGSRLS